MDDYINRYHCKECPLKIELFNCLNDDELDEINKSRFQVKYNPGEIIFKQGTAMTHLICVTNGLVKIYLEGIRKRNLILRFIKPVTIIGGPGMFVDRKNHFTAKTVEETIACHIDANVFEKIVENNSNFALALLKWINEFTVDNFKKYIELTQKNMPGRIAGALLYLYNEIYNEDKHIIKINRQDLADLTAMSKESAIRKLKEFKDDRLIKTDSSKIFIKKLDQLKAISHYG